MSCPFRLVIALLSGLGVCAAASADEPRFGRLFHTPEERGLLDRQGTLVATTPPAPPAEPQASRLDGIVRRSDGRSTVWIDGRRADMREATPTPDARAAVITMPDGKRRRLQVGESTKEAGSGR